MQVPRICPCIIRLVLFYYYTENMSNILPLVFADYKTIKPKVS